MRAFLGMGSNLGDRRQTMRDAVAAIDEAIAVSPVYETDPVGGPEQGAFYNIVVELDTTRSPRQLLALCAELEQAANRVRVVRWGPRTLDVDVLLIGRTGDVTVDEDDLTVPHPRMLDRNFVMAPLLDLAPDLEPAMKAAGYNPATAIGEVANIGPL